MTTISTPIFYPDSDGEPMADNTLQFEWISLIKWELEALYANNPEVFVAGDLLWYPVQGSNRTRTAPDAMVVFGRPKGYRGSYRQWEEDNIAPQVVFEVLSPGNRAGEMGSKLAFYDRYGVEEYYLYDPDDFSFSGWVRSEGRLTYIDRIGGWVSPRLGIRFEPSDERDLEIYRPDGTLFRTPLEVRQELAQTQIERDTAKAERDALQTERERLAAKLRELGIDPDAV